MVRQAPVLDNTIQKFIDELSHHDAPPIYELTPEEARNTLLQAQSLPVDKPEVEIKDLQMNWEPGPVHLRIFRPINAKGITPVVVYFHGGGWVMGDTTTHDRLLRELTAATGATLVFVDYSRSPEAKYPVAIEQAYAAILYVAKYAGEFGVDPAHLAVAGDSAGGNIAAVVSMLAKERSGPHIAGQLLFYPVTNADFETPSYQQFADGPWLTRRAMQWFWDQYLPDRMQRKDSHAAPLQAPLSVLTGLPQILIITAENDVLRDEGEAYGRRLIEAGVETVTTRYNGAIHDFVMLNGIANAPPARAAIAQASDFLRHVLS
ncbi:alpha/beta hydrolase [Terriglobus albidus]|uniref:alpha/beta hydrolase n=1 Tax=Terriglobus albidus TaxID=1592106 RepID=UPI0021E04A4B|nr:alpha/beta hydrolase [Terriglobus albidus]